MRNQRWRRRFVNLVFIIAGVLIAGSLLQWYHGRLKKWLAMGIALVFITPLLIWERYYPRPFELSADGDKVDYEFLNLEYAAEFSVLNEENDDVDDSDPLPG